MHASSRFAFPGAKLVDANWNGAPMCLAQNESVQMTTTPNGSMILAFQNMSTMNNDGTLSVSSGGQQPQSFDAPQLSTVPNILVQNWHANNLTLANLSANPNTPIRIQAYGPGMPGQTPKQLPSDGTAVPVQLGDSLQTASPGGWMRLTFSDTSGTPGLFALIGGPADASGNNAYAIAVNLADPIKPPGYYAVTTQNSYRFPDFNWTTVIYVAYFGAGRVVTPPIAGAPRPTVTLLSF